MTSFGGSHSDSMHGDYHIFCVQELQDSNGKASQWLNLNGPDNPITLPVLQLLLATRTSVR
jgi:hypothetical protein